MMQKSNLVTFEQPSRRDSGLAAVWASLSRMLYMLGRGSSGEFILGPLDTPQGKDIQGRAA